jgi:hypothetical protein
MPELPEKVIEEYTCGVVARSVEYDSLKRGIETEASNEAGRLLIDSLRNKSNEFGIRALQAIGLLSSRDTMNLAIEVLEKNHAAQRANVIEALESINARWRNIIQPLTRLWEDDSASNGNADWQRLMDDEDPWIRDCASFALHALGEIKMENLTTLSLMERILFFKRVPLFANLSSTDIKQVAAIAQEESFSDGVTIARQGEPGDVMFIIVSGEIRVLTIKDQKEVEIARRREGEYVGEMALISKGPRIATLTAVGHVRALCLDQKSFELLLRDRPDASLAVIQELCQRLKDASIRLEG